MAPLLASLSLTGCASWLPPFLKPAPKLQGDHFSGRLSVRVENDSQRSFSAAFELAGTDKEGELSLSTPLGPQLARARWSPRRVELKTPQRVKEYASLDQLAVEAMGENVPITALFDWLTGRPWPGAPSRMRQQGFEQLGWQVDVARLSEGAIVATRPQPTPAVVVRVRLDGS
ncbi:MAG TPA: lipoprotein insertase outer membrane protein LolB [Burkholderiaceae bacterium]|nr:lipoprotein insertase outer membrane protein LolB [Burkholderiaceae bacterium]